MIHVGKLELEIDDILSNIHKLSHFWIRRSDAPFFTLGRNVYMDGKTEAYMHESSILNPKLIEHFQDLYINVQVYLTHLIGEQVHLNHEFAYPSFHIFESDPAFLTYPSNWHTDYPYDTLGLKKDSPSSFTVVIAIPKSGAGLEYLDGEEKYLEYNVGDIIHHDGRFLHNIARLKEYVPGEYRITLQGHIIRHNDRLIMYW